MNLTAEWHTESTDMCAGPRQLYLVYAKTLHLNKYFFLPNFFWNWNFDDKKRIKQILLELQFKIKE